MIEKNLQALEKYNSILESLPDELAKKVDRNALFIRCLEKISKTKSKEFFIVRYVKFLVRIASELRNKFIWKILKIISKRSIKLAQARNISIAHYQIDKFLNKQTFDGRSDYVTELLNQDEILNIIHTSSPQKSLLISHKKVLPVYFEAFLSENDRKNKVKSIDSIFSKFPNALISEILEKDISTFDKKFFSRILFIKKFLFIDDARHTFYLRILSQKRKIETFAYMHGRFNEFHTGLMYPPFNNYLLWSDYYKKFLSINHYYSSTNFFISGPPFLRKKNNYDDSFSPKKNTNILLIGEDNVNPDYIYEYCKELKKIPNSEIFYRPKSDKIEYKFLDKNSYILDNSNSLQESLHKNKIDVVIGTHSTALIESLLYGIPSILLSTPIDYGDHLIRDQVCYLCKSPDKIYETIRQTIKLSKKDIKTLEKRIWSKSYYDYSEIKCFISKLKK